MRVGCIAHLHVVETGSRGRAAVGDRVAALTLARQGVTVSLGIN
jgi:hypothetical protein